MTEMFPAAEPIEATAAAEDPADAAMSLAARAAGPSRMGGALRGDLTQGPILKTLIAFSIPALVANIFQTIGGSINAIWVGQLLGTSAVAATANANIIMFLLFGTVFGFGMATTIQVGRHYGGKDVVAARRSFGGGIGFCIALALVVAVIGSLFAPAILRLMATPPEARDQALAYLRITFISMPFTAAAMTIGMGLRGSGDATTPMVSSIITVLLDIALNPMLIRGIGPFPRLGIAGSALSSASASVIGAGVMIATVYLRDLPLRLRGRELGFIVPSRAELSFMLAKGFPMGAQVLISTAAGLVMVGLVNRQGLIAAAAYGASLQLWNYVQMPAMAIGSAMSGMVSQNIGARQHHRVNAITGAGIVATLAVTGTLTAAILLFDAPVLGLFLGHGSPAVPLARHIQRICTWSFLMSGGTMALFATMRAYGSVLVPLIILAVSMYAMRLGFYFLAHATLGNEAVWWAYPAGSIGSLGMGLLAWQYGPWRRAQAAAIVACR